MLPDFIATKRVVSKRVEEMVREAGLHTPLLRMLRRYHIHEGESFRIEGEEDWVDEKTIQPKKIEATISAEDIRQHGPKAFADLPRQFIEQMRQHASKNAYDSLDEVTSRTGMVTQSAGPPSPDSLLEGFGKMDMEFDKHGTWQPQTLQGTKRNAPYAGGARRMPSRFSDHWKECRKP